MQNKEINKELIENFDRFYQKLTKKEKGLFLTAFSHEFRVSQPTIWSKRKDGTFTPAEQRFITNYFESHEKWEEYNWLLNEAIEEEVE